MFWNKHENLKNLIFAIMAIFLLITKQKLSFKSIKKEFPLLLVSGIAMGFLPMRDIITVSFFTKRNR